ncbi:TPA: hypothetical protein QEM95_14035 [Stenotrophomonas maltophilia]|nr:hypothetical protein [Stenotrophomonas maltophilia]
MPIEMMRPTSIPASMMNRLNEQFDIFSNSMRLLPESIFRLAYFLNEINEPEEGISNVEAAYNNVLNCTYGLMTALKEASACESIYEHDAITTVLCIRHVLQHQPGRIKNNLRDAWSLSTGCNPTLIRYSASDPSFPDQPFFLRINWIQAGIAQSNNARRLPAINSFWSLDEIRAKVEQRGLNWSESYVCALALITESARTIVSKYGHLIEATGYDSKVYLQHFAAIDPVDTRDYSIEEAAATCAPS